ncbi:hypothetical protein RRG08_036072 [Elysia crispata]|uniref:MANSC domain-containing protein n=1 Tax=Elysia crispata TaxID=231223 RepID=A0AAE1E0I0_9GAST|nr:hypothetical protein RRG08_036072 [Elysia crispata]
MTSPAGMTNQNHLALVMLALVWTVRPCLATSSSVDAQCTMVPVNGASSTGQSSEEPVVTDVRVSSGLSECVLLCCMEETCDAIILETKALLGDPNCAFLTCNKPSTCRDIEPLPGEAVLIKLSVMLDGQTSSTAEASFSLTSSPTSSINPTSTPSVGSSSVQTTSTSATPLTTTATNMAWNHLRQIF